MLLLPEVSEVLRWLGRWPAFRREAMGDWAEVGMQKGWEWSAQSSSRRPAWTELCTALHKAQMFPPLAPLPL